MSKISNPYQNFSSFVLRTPILPLNYFEHLTGNNEVSDTAIKEAFRNPVVNEAIFLASPSFHREAEKWCIEKFPNDKIKISLLKYLTRMSSRCTPFGLFAGCSLGTITDETNIELKGAKKNKRYTRLDMNYLVALSQDLTKNELIKDQLLFYPNSSLYKIGKYLRYVEYHYENSRRQHNMVAIVHSEFLESALNLAKNGAYLKDLIFELVNDDISQNEAKDFIEELLESQVLVSELEPSVSGTEFLDQMLDVLKKLKGTKELISILNQADKQLQNIDKTLGNNTSNYIDLSEYLKQLETEFELKFLFQTDVELSCSKNTLSRSVVNSVKKGISILNRITLPAKETSLSKFREAYYERYEEKLVDLAKALDIESGVGYLQNQGSGDVSPLIDDIILPLKENQTKENITISNFHKLLHKKITKALIEQKYSVVFSDDDFNGFEQPWDDLPDTLSCMIEIITIDGEEKIIFLGGGGSSAANLLGRFCHGNKDINNYCQSIIELETKMNSKKILAEIVHLPESRVGNILMRPDFRDFEIPYLAKSNLDDKHQLRTDDLVLDINPRKITLLSKKTKKEIIPRLTNAHNYCTNSLPIYHFLADMQTQGLRSDLGFNLGPFAKDYDFIPRIEYQNIVFHEATWNLEKKDFKTLVESTGDNAKLRIELDIFLKKRNIPNLVLLVEGDNQLLINFKNLTSARMFLELVKKKESFTIKEFLFDNNSIVNNKKDYYTNQVILSFYNDSKVPQK